MAKLEGDLKKLKVDLQVARNKENELRDQIVSSAASKLHRFISNKKVFCLQNYTKHPRKSRPFY